MNKLSISLLAVLLLTLEGCGDRSADKPGLPPQTPKQEGAVSKLKEAAAAGNAEAQNNLGWVYFNGHGAVQDPQEGIKWFRLAAAQGYTKAMLTLGGLYRNGQGVPQDYVRAQMWFSLAAAKGDSEAREVNDMAVKHLTPAQLAESKKMAQDCEGSSYKNCG